MQIGILWVNCIGSLPKFFYTVMKDTSNLLIVFCLFGFFIGCGSRDKIPEGLTPVSGKVTFNGEPIAIGSIAFVPVDQEAGQRGDGRSVSITDGVFSLGSMLSMRPGEYIVQVTSQRSYDKTTKGEVTPQTEDQNIVREELIPVKYNKKSELRATVTESGPNTFDFDLKK